MAHFRLHLWMPLALAALSGSSAWGGDCLFLGGSQDSAGKSQVRYSTCRPSDKLVLEVKPLRGKTSRHEIPRDQRSTRVSQFELRVPPTLSGSLGIERIGANGQVLERKTLDLPLGGSRRKTSSAPASCLSLSGELNAQQRPEVTYSTCKPEEKLIMRVEPQLGSPASYEFPAAQKSTSPQQFVLKVPARQSGRLVLERQDREGNVLEQKSISMPFLDAQPKEYPNEIAVDSPKPAHLAPPRERIFTRTTFEPGQLRLGPMAFMQWGTTLPTVGISWNPRVEWSSGVFAGIGAGISPLRNALDETFLASDIQLSAGSFFDEHWGVELAGGLQAWSKHGGTYPLATATFLYRFDYDVIRVFDSLFASYGAYFMTNHYTAEIRAGVGMAF